MSALNPGFWLNRRVLVTGHTGFKGSYLAYWLAEMGANVVGYAQPATMSARLYSSLNLDHHIESITGDITDLSHLEAVIASREPEVIFHLAADALVLSCLKNPVRAFAVNVQGTANLLHAARRSQDLRSVLVATSDKCYRPSVQPRGENSPLGGDEPYAASKAAAEMAVQAFRHCYLQAFDGIGVASMRAGNVIGGGDFSANRLVPDLIRGLRLGQPVPVRNPECVRPWLHVLDALNGYLLLAERLWSQPDKFAAAWNFGPPPNGEWPVRRVADLFCQYLGGEWQHVPRRADIESPVLRLNTSKASTELGWVPHLTTQEALTWTLRGYQEMLEGRGEDWLHRQISEFEDLMLRSEAAIESKIAVTGAGFEQN